MRDQVELTFIYGTQERDNSVALFHSKIIMLASEMCGGCTVHLAKGYWMTDGATHARTFKGDLEQEYTKEIVVTCELDKEHLVYNNMRMHMAAWAEELELDIDWVHVKRKEFTGMHFSLKDEAEGMSRVDYRDIVSPGTRGSR